MNTLNPEKSVGEYKEKIENIVKRNQAIAEIVGFKTYKPSNQVYTDTINQYQGYNIPVKFYFLPNVGRYNNYELKFDRDWNWIMSACIELRKYRETHKYKHDKLTILYNHIEGINVINVEMENLWKLVSDYCLELLNQKEKEK